MNFFRLLGGAWFAPQATTRWAIDRRLVLAPVLVGGLTGILQMLPRSVADAAKSGSTDLTDAIVLSGVVGFFLGNGLLYLASLALCVAGKPPGGQATPNDLRRALAVALVPLLVQGLLDSLLLGLILGAVPGLDPMGSWLDIILAVWPFVAGALAAWSVILLALATAEAHRVPLWKAVLAILFVVVPVVGLALGWMLSPRSTVAVLFGLLMLGFVVGGLFGAALMVTSLFNRGRMPVWALRLINRGLFRSPPPQPGPPLTLRQLYPLLPFPHSVWLLVLLGLAVVFFLLNPLFANPEKAPVLEPMAEMLRGLSTVLAYGLVALGGYFHFQPNHDRRVKYELVVSGLALAMMMHTAADVKLPPSAIVQNPEAFEAWKGEAIGAVFGFPVWSVMVGPVLALLFRWEASTGRPPSWLVRRAYRSTSMPATVTLVFLFLGTSAGALAGLGEESGESAGGFSALLGAAALYLTVRYFAYQRMLDAPIVFLRSFHDKDAAAAFGQIVMRTAAPYAPVVALTHSLQPPEEIYSRMSLDQAARLATAADAHWQDWVLNYLKRCTAVIFDATLGTGGLRWELDTAFVVVPPSRIALLVRGEPDLAVPPGVLVLRYELTRSGERQARADLKHWLTEAVTTPREPEEKLPIISVRS